MPDTNMVREYACCQCRRYHREGSDPLFTPHLMHQSKRGWWRVRADAVYFALNEGKVAAELAAAAVTPPPR